MIQEGTHTQICTGASVANLYRSPDAYKRLTKLKALRIISAVVGVGNESWLLDFLAALQYTSLKSLKLVYHIEEPRTYGIHIEESRTFGTGWDALFELILRRPQFSKLQELQICISNGESWDSLGGIRDTIRRRYENGLRSSFGPRCALTFGNLSVVLLNR